MLEERPKRHAGVPRHCKNRLIHDLLHSVHDISLLAFCYTFFRFIFTFHNISKPEHPSNGCSGLVVELFYSSVLSLCRS